MTWGPVSLVGGGEHLEACVRADRLILDLVGSRRPRVAILPVAASRRSRPAVSALGRTHWRRLGVDAAICGVEAGWLEHDLEVVAAADVVVLPGGHPGKLMRRLVMSPLFDAVVARWRSGGALIGSSAGAMCLFERRLWLYPPNPLRVAPGLGVLGGYVVAPHFDRFRAVRWAHRVVSKVEGGRLLGIDESTALIGSGDGYHVVGPGAVTVVSPGHTKVLPSGALVGLYLALPAGRVGSPRGAVAARPRLAGVAWANGRHDPSPG